MSREFNGRGIIDVALVYGRRDVCLGIATEIARAKLSVLFHGRFSRAMRPRVIIARAFRSIQAKEWFRLLWPGQKSRQGHEIDIASTLASA